MSAVPRDPLAPYRTRQALKRAITHFFDGRDYLEIDTPILVVSPGTEVHLGYFATEWSDHYGEAYPMFLRSSPELHLKQLLAQGVKKVWNLSKCFRNHGEHAHWHHPEFTMLEWYEAGISFEGFMKQTEELIRFVTKELKEFEPQLVLPRTIPKMSVSEAFKEFAGITLVDEDDTLARTAIAKKVLSVKADDDFETAFFKILLEKIEPGLKALKAVFLYDYPASQAALSTIDGIVAKRFELYVNGIELCNAFHELTDPRENVSRIKKAQRMRAALQKVPVPDDEEFYEALQHGIPASCGNALGFDRLLALLMGDPGLDRAVPFRTMHPYKPRARKKARKPTVR